MRDHLLAFIAFLLLSLGAVIFLQPDRVTQLEANLSRLAPEEALELLEGDGAYDPEQHDIVHFHAELLRSSGEFDRARRLFETLALRLPNNGSVLQSLYDIAIFHRDLNSAMAHRSELSENTDEQLRDEPLALMHRLDRDSAGEIEVLSSKVPELLSEWEANRLARLLLSLDRANEAEALYLHLSNSRVPYAKEARNTFLVFLIDDGRATEAVGHALDWYKDAEFEFQVIEEFLPVFIGRGALDEALWLADRSLETSPETAHRMMEIFYLRGHRFAAQRLKDEILSKSEELSHAEWEALIEFTSVTGDVSGLQIAVGRITQDPVPPGLLSDALLQILRYAGARALVPFRTLVSRDVVDHAPLIAAALSVDQGQFPATVEHLVSASEMDLSDWEQAVWSRIAHRLQGSGYDKLLATNVRANPNLASVARDIVRAR